MSSPKPQFLNDHLPFSLLTLPPLRVKFRSPLRETQQDTIHVQPKIQQLRLRLAQTVLGSPNLNLLPLIHHTTHASLNLFDPKVPGMTCSGDYASSFGSLFSSPSPR